MTTRPTFRTPLIHTLTKKIVLAALLLGMSAVGSACQAGQPTPPQSGAFGMSFEDWNVAQTSYAIEAGLGTDPDPDDTVGRVRLLPGSFFDPTPEFDITMPPGTPFVAAPFFVFGESYDDPNVPDDDPLALADLLALIFATTDIETVIDGEVLLDGTGAELSDFLFGPVYFDEPIVYAEPQARGPDLNATAALWVMGIGSVYRPLPVGEHTLVSTVDSAFFGFMQFTYHITVTP